jgi:thiol-disulfide isomerase/thioredoxin
MKTRIYLLALLFCCCTLVVQAQITGPKNLPVTSVPDIMVYDLNGKQVNLKELAKNKVLFIDNWFIPCPQCFIEMNILHKLYAKYAGNKDFCLITISRTDSAIVKKFIAKDSSMAKYVNTYQFFSRLDYFKLPVYFIPGCNAKVQMAGKSLHALQPDDPGKCADNVFSFSGYPAVFIFDKQGKLIFNKVGYDGKDDEHMAEIEKAIKPALAAN